jgi:hypothetical protein
MRKRTLESKYGFIVLFLLPSNQSIACQCPEKIPFAEDYRASGSIVTGRVVSKKVKTYQYHQNGIRDKWTYFEYEIQVKQTYKGERLKTLRVATARKDPACGMRFERGEDYLIYAHPDKRYGLYIGNCNRNFLLSDSRSKADLIALEKKKGRE